MAKAQTTEQATVGIHIYQSGHVYYKAALKRLVMRVSD